MSPLLKAPGCGSALNKWPIGGHFGAAVAPLPPAATRCFYTAP
jgi:hypothetical protein